MVQSAPSQTSSNASAMQALLNALLALGIDVNSIPGGATTTNTPVEASGAAMSGTPVEASEPDVTTEPADSDTDAASHAATEDAENASDTGDEHPAAGDGAGGSSLVADPNNDGAQGIICTRCRTFNAVRAASEPAYVVTVGLQVGVFTEWHIVQGLVSGVRGACFRKYGSNAAAQAAFAEALNAGVVMVVAPPPVAHPIQGSSRGSR